MTSAPRTHTLRRRLFLQALEDRAVPATFTVNALTDTGAGAGNAGDLRYCMTQALAATSPGADAIVFDAATVGTIFVTSPLPAIDDALTVTGNGSAKNRLDLNNTPLATAIFVTDAAFLPGATVGLTGLTMANANSSADMYVTLTDANANLTDLVIDKGKGSAITSRALNFFASAPATFTPTITLTNSSITGTTSTFVPTAGGYYTYSAPLFSRGCDITVTGTTIANNSFNKNGTFGSGPFSGGAVLIGDAAANLAAGNSIVISKSAVTGNTFFGRAAITTFGGIKSQIISDSRVDNNKAESRGGGMNLQSNDLGDIQILRTSISGNLTLGQGAGAYIGNAATVLMESCSVVGNQGLLGIAGGLWFDGFLGTSTVQVSNSTIASNISGSTALGTSSGGGVRIGQANVSNGTTFRFDNCTIANNKQTNGAIRHFNGNVFVNSCVFEGNNGTTPNIADFDSLNAPTQMQDTLYNPSKISPGTPGVNFVSGNILDTAAKLNAPADNGGGFLTMLPQAGSPVINKGSNTIGLTFDQRGGPLHVRSFGGGVDMGAIEAITFIPFVTGTKTDGTVTASNVNKYNIEVTFADNTANIDVASLKTGNITVTGKAFPAGINATFDHVDINTNGTPRTAFYFVNSPGAFFTAADNDTYNVTMNANQVKTTDVPNRFVPPGPLASFSIAVSQTFTVTTTDDVVDPLDGKTSLREAINSANGSKATDSIAFNASFAAPQTINLALGVLDVTDALVINNPGGRLTINAGGASGIFNVTGSLISMNNLTLANGNRTGKAANALHIPGDVTATVTNCTFENNTSGQGAALWNNSGPLTITDSQFINNTSSDSGGAIYLRIATAVIDRCSFTGNTATTTGGAIDCNFNAQFAVDLTIRNSTFSGNSGSNGGALYVDQAKAFVLENSTISSNTAGGNGGGISVNVTAAQVGSTTIRNSTITQNVSNGTGAGGVHIIQATADPINIVSTIIAGNTDIAATNPDFSGPTTSSFSKSLLGVANSFTPSTADLTAGGNLFGDDTTPLNPQLEALALNGAPAGSPFTHALKTAGPASPALNKGSNPASLSFDQRGTGFNRTSGTGTDIGAFEVQVAGAPAKVANVKIGDGTTQRSTIRSLTITFDQKVGLPGTIADAFSLTKQGGGAVILAGTVDGTGAIVTLTFTGGEAEFASLKDGRYNFTIDATKVTTGGGTIQLDGDNNGSAGGNYVQNSATAPAAPTNIWRLFGDSDGDNDVDSTDFGAFRQVYGGSSTVFDYDNDGDVDTGDFGQFRARFGGSV